MGWGGLTSLTIQGAVERPGRLQALLSGGRPRINLEACPGGRREVEELSKGSRREVKEIEELSKGSKREVEEKLKSSRRVKRTRR